MIIIPTNIKKNILFSNCKGYYCNHLRKPLGDICELWIKCSGLICHVLHYPIEGQGISFVLLTSYSWARLDTDKVSALFTVEEADGSDSRRRLQTKSAAKRRVTHCIF